MGKGTIQTHTSFQLMWVIFFMSVEEWSGVLAPLSVVTRAGVSLTDTP
jgi:hypothetical protein